MRSRGSAAAQSVIAGLIAVMACSAAKAATEASALRRDARAVLARWNDAMARHDVDALAALWSDDVEVVSPRKTWRGRVANRDFAASLFARRPDLKLTRRSRRLEIADDGTVAADAGRWRESWHEPDGQVHLGGMYFMVWQRSASGWILQHESFAATTCSGSRYCRN